MIIKRVDVRGVRNLHPVSLHLARLNFIYGANGSGKSSLLEAVHLLATGRSFRSNQIRKIINVDESSCHVVAELADGRRMGLQKSVDGQQLLKMNGEAVSSLALFASELPVQLIHPDGMDLLDGPSKQRRQLLDWLVFHVEHSFYPLWLRYQRALLQRNALLKKLRVQAGEWEVWERELATSAVALHQQRQSVFRDWLNFVRQYQQELLPDLQLEFGYSPGFDADEDFQVHLATVRDRDRERGHTLQGPHRADLRLKTDLGPVEAVLSRGQKKALIAALRLAQVAFLWVRLGRQTVVLLDDLASELDEAARLRLLSCLQSLQAQVVMTAIDLSAWQQLQQVAGDAVNLFHVEHGVIVPQG